MLVWDGWLSLGSSCQRTGAENLSTSGSLSASSSNVITLLEMKVIDRKKTEMYQGNQIIIFSSQVQP